MAGILQNETVWANAAKMPPAAWYEMYVKPWHPELAVGGYLGMRVLTGVDGTCLLTGNRPRR